MKRVMVIDDTPDTLEITTQVLKMNNFEVKAYERARPALDELSSGRKYDLVLLDMRMPDLSGIDFCKDVRANPKTKKTRIVFFTASSDLDKSLLKKWGVLGYIFKPFHIDELVKEVNMYMRK